MSTRSSARGLALAQRVARPVAAFSATEQISDLLTRPERVFYHGLRANVAAQARPDEQAIAEYKRKWYQRNRERLLAQQREYRERNREQISAQRAAAYRRDPERIQERQRRWRTANPAHVSALRRAGYQRNRETILRTQRAAYALNRERRRAQSAAYREQNRERVLAWQRAYNARNREEVNRKNREHARRVYASDPRRREYLRDWEKAHPERIRAYRRATWHKRRGALGDGFTTAEWEALLEKDAYRCAYCGADGATHADHRVPIARGGRNEISNILPSCRRCNRRKGTRTEEEFRALLAAGAWPDHLASSGRGASHSRKASKANGRPRKSTTRVAAGLVPPAASTRSR